MNLLELKKQVDNAIDRTKNNGDKPENIIVTIQIDEMFTENVELHYDGDLQASGCVLVGWKE